jgi:predicted AlkP superfamily phosphohydrolase/phosphomutase
MPVPSCDWARTVAVPLPTDQHGWVRINLCGREVAGAVEPGDYLATLDRVERILRDARDAAGRPVIEEVRRVAEAAGGTPPARLPDLVVHWSDATQVDPLALATPRLHARPIGLKFTGQHAPDGFFVWRPGHGAADTPDTVAAEQLHRLL